MALSDQLNRDMIRAISDNPVTFTWSATAYVGSWSPLLRQKPLREGGFLEEPDATLCSSMKKFAADGTTLTSRFASDTPPDVNALITISGTTYRVARRHYDDWGVAVQWDLETRHK